MPGAQQPINEARKNTFLKVLAKTGIMVWAARAASPHSQDHKGAISGFRSLMARSPDFAAQVQEARDEADALLEHTAWLRAVEGVAVKQFQKGIQVVDAEGNPGYQTVYSDRLLETLLQARDKRFARQHRHEHTGHIQHSSTSILQLATEDMDALSLEHREQLTVILIQVQANRKGAAVPQLTHNPGVVIEGDSEVVTGEPVKVYARKKFDKSESLKEYRAAIEGDADTLAAIEAIEAERNAVCRKGSGGGNEQG